MVNNARKGARLFSILILNCLSKVYTKSWRQEHKGTVQMTCGQYKLKIPTVLEKELTNDSFDRDCY